MSKGQATAKEIADRIRRVIDEFNQKQVQMPQSLVKAASNKPGSSLYLANLFRSKKSI